MKRIMFNDQYYLTQSTLDRYKTNTRRIESCCKFIPDAMFYQIKITGIKIERLQNISNEDCLKEGIKNDMMDSKGYNFSYKDDSKIGYYEFFEKPREAFAHFIDKVSKKGIWESNPYVVAYEFELVKYK
jgi:hypothetical protein